MPNINATQMGRYWTNAIYLIIQQQAIPNGSVNKYIKIDYI